MGSDASRILSRARRWWMWRLIVRSPFDLSPFIPAPHHFGSNKFPSQYSTMLGCRTMMRRLDSRSLRSFSSFSWSGPRELDDIVKKELLVDKSNKEVSEIWLKYHEEKEAVYGTILGGQEGQKFLSRAKESPFFIQPVFRDDGFFMLVSQFQADQHFLMAYLEDYKMDPTAASPLLTFSVFTDYADDLDLSLVRSEVVNQGINDGEAVKVINGMMTAYTQDDEYEQVHNFNQTPEKFDVDDYISRQNQRWKV